MNKENEIKSSLISLAEYYNYRISLGALSMMVEDLNELTIEELRVAMRKWRTDAKNRVFPLPAQLIQLARPQDSISDLDVARTLANRIWGAISKLGYTNAEKAKQELGDLGWSVCERMGGWVNICQTAQEDQRGIFVAQCRELTEATIRLQRAGKLDHKFALTDFSTDEDVKALTQFVVQSMQVPKTLEMEQ